MRKWKNLLGRVKVRHIRAAINEIRNGERIIPRRRRAKKWFLVVSGRSYPTKYILARAVKIATRKHFPTDARSGGKQTLNALNKILKKDPKIKIVQRRP
jgi:hypothetical protein